MVTRQALWVCHLLQDVLKMDYVGHLLCDNQSAVPVAIDDSSNKRTHHTDHEISITNESLFQKKTTLTCTPTASQMADIFTKLLGREILERMKGNVMGNG